MKKSETQKKLMKAIDSITEKAGNSRDSGDALRFTQAVLNATHALQIIGECKIEGNNGG